ncbi:MAG: hypothetical protein K0R34_1233 [Herbinix sp.]|nr:hypothetical protein [Herbinix sp.]
MLSLDILKGKSEWHIQCNSLFPHYNNKNSGDPMSYVAPAIREKFETLSVDLKNTILERNVELNSIHDLINVLDAIVKEADAEEK